RQHQELGAGTNRVPEPGAGSGTAANIKGSVTRSRDNYLENRRSFMGKNRDGTFSTESAGSRQSSPTPQGQNQPVSGG
ncbi:hypothetical protein, partial [Pseudomonas sp. WS 5011]|uniref:hypothetical protein n=1 Tax=Pseudomonas sp. WS 5011 TaxID=2717477 RepID=UPI001CB73052